RKDNGPQKPGDAKGWVTALRDEILADHRRFSTEPLRIFFDTSEIRDMDDWRHRILDGLRHSRILLVCLSPDYFASNYCRWEFEEYIQRQVHQLMGFDSFAQVYFVEVPGVSEQAMAKGWYELLRRTNYTDLRPWFPQGVEALREAAVRDRLAALGTSLYERIQRARRATGVPGNLRRLNPHFIGRRTELRQLHENLALGAVGVVTAVHGLGGQGKTELAIAYAHGWADSYPGGLWVLGAEGRKEILPLLGELCAELQIPLSAGPDETGDDRGRRALAELHRRALEAAPHDPDQGAATLVILDNVSDPALLAQPQLALIPREDWLRVVATTREGPEKFPASRQKSLAFIAVDALTGDDAARLIEDHQIETGGQWPPATAAADAAAARAIARELGGFTLAVESVAIYLGLHPDIRPAAYLARLRAEGLPGVDDLVRETDPLTGEARVAAEMHHREKQLRLVLDQTLAKLTPAERAALDYAALLPPDSIPWPWLRAVVAQEHEEMRDPEAERRQMLRQGQGQNPLMAGMLEAPRPPPALLHALKAQTP
ncbi:MAG TPA: toll/interleukin-1 receptor domain-containing protein, partial [Verrucomicrobiota bacterium]|nr:toll/interleukin-1 receptor domain-containing protein [Verrucomicrobiota bacterium]